MFSVVFWEYFQVFWVVFPPVLLPEESPPGLQSVLLPHVFERPGHLCHLPRLLGFLVGFLFY